MNCRLAWWGIKYRYQPVFMLLCYPLLLDFAPNSVPWFSCSFFCLFYTSLPKPPSPWSHHIPTSHLSPSCLCPGSFHPWCQVGIFILVWDKTLLFQSWSAAGHSFQMLGTRDACCHGLAGQPHAKYSAADLASGKSSSQGKLLKLQ